MHWAHAVRASIYAVPQIRQAISTAGFQARSHDGRRRPKAAHLPPISTRTVLRRMLRPTPSTISGEADHSLDGCCRTSGTTDDRVLACAPSPSATVRLDDRGHVLG